MQGILPGDLHECLLALLFFVILPASARCLAGRLCLELGRRVVCQSIVFLYDTIKFKLPSPQGWLWSVSDECTLYKPSLIC